MPSTNLIIALILAAIFGAALVWLTLYYVHRYVHRRCLELDHWFHLSALRQPEPQTCCYDQEHGRRSHSKSRLRSARIDKRRGRSQYERSRKRYESREREHAQGREVHTEWPGQQNVTRARPMLPMSEPVQNQWQEQQFYPPFGWHGQTPGGFQMAYPQPMLHQQVRGQPFAMPVAVPQQPFSPKPTAMPESTQFQRQYQQPCTETCSDTVKDSHSEKPPARPKPPPRYRCSVNEVDYIHICDEYPQIVLEALNKAEAPPSSSSSSATSSTTQEVPRPSIPRAAPRAADNAVFEFPQYPHLATRAWNAPTSYPRQWMDHRAGGDMGNVRIRYAPFEGLSGPAQVNANPRRQAPSNAPL
ncbi:uncharacterized protein K460DRAFT_58686 [Cucurbitaria berberidis CBS 394.84]|uniref:Uncharacterized protein n=1 Tax=Cucurbitaria berberidis CBS 394.84 TaxID=1168544 RepID=A0A9P4GLN3_9PLEO|nr:uncharacterized protein K460DRAFT_58686 [Cucurbitaria berberidis CBS 394.84]KAF1847464.1 hypothetical protein K460DRAFT_58686 [Cucurbitaria berberidis CBS 394.84]